MMRRKIKVKTQRMALACLLFSLMLVPLTGWAEYTEGVEYVEVSPQPVDTGAKIEVREFFWYSCPHCYHLEPVLNRWRKTLSPKVEFVRTPAIFRDTWAVQARAYFAFQALGVTHKLTRLCSRPSMNKIAPWILKLALRPSRWSRV